jgi:hypothetical protein
MPCQLTTDLANNTCDGSEIRRLKRGKGDVSVHDGEGFARCTRSIGVAGEVCGGGALAHRTQSSADRLESREGERGRGGGVAGWRRRRRRVLVLVHQRVLFHQLGSSSFSTELQPGPAGPNLSEPLDEIILLIFVEK